MTLGDFFIVTALSGGRNDSPYYESYEEQKENLKQDKIRDKLIAEEREIVWAINKINPIIDENKELLSDIYLQLIEKDDEEFTKNIEEANNTYYKVRGLWADDKESYDEVIVTMERVVSIKRKYCEGILKTLEHISKLSGKSIEELLREKPAQIPPKTPKSTPNTPIQKNPITPLSVLSNVFFLPFKKIFALSFGKAVFSLLAMFFSWILTIYIFQKFFHSSNTHPFISLGLLLLASHIVMALFKQPSYEKSLMYFISSSKIIKYFIGPLWNICFKTLLSPFEKILSRNILKGIFGLFLIFFTWFILVCIFSFTYLGITKTDKLPLDWKISLFVFGLFFISAHIIAYKTKPRQTS